MQTTRESGRLLAVKDGWAACPICGKPRLIRILPETRAKSLPVYCKHCKTESIVNIDPSLSHERLSQ